MLRKSFNIHTASRTRSQSQLQHWTLFIHDVQQFGAEWARGVITSLLTPSVVSNTSTEQFLMELMTQNFSETLFIFIGSLMPFWLQCCRLCVLGKYFCKKKKKVC